MNEPQMPFTAAVCWALAMLLGHVVAVAALVFELVYRVPKYVRIYRDFNLALDAPTRWSVLASNWAVENVFLLGLFLFVLLSADGLLLAFLNMRSRRSAWGWFGLVLVVPLGLALAAEAVNWNTLAKLLAGLSP